MAIQSRTCLLPDGDQAVVHEVRQPDERERERQDAQARDGGEVVVAADER